jgi:hypothetical protein
VAETLQNSQDVGRRGIKENGGRDELKYDIFNTL